MKWFRKTFVWASVGCLGAASSVAAQGTVWRATSGEPADVRPASADVTLGRPTPIAPETLRVVQANVPAGIPPMTGVQKATYIVRGAGPEAPKGLLLPKDLPPLDDSKTVPVFPPLAQPAQAIKPPPKDKAKIIDIGAEDKTKGSPKKDMPKAITPATDPTERIIILPEGSGFGDEQGRSLFGFLGGADRRFYARGEFLAWTARSYHIPPLVTTANPGDDPNTIGALGFGSTRLIYGDSNLGGGLRPAHASRSAATSIPLACAPSRGAFSFSRKKTTTPFSPATTSP